MPNRTIPNGRWIPLAVLAATVAMASAVEEPVEVGWNAAYFKGIPADAGHALVLPADWRLQEWSEAAGVVAVGLTLYAEDEPIDAWFQNHRSARSDAIASKAKLFGREALALGLIGTAGASFVVSDPRVARTALLGTESVAFAMAGYGVVQVMTNRARPSSDRGRDSWGGPGLHSHDHSFPSGHATAAFAGATVLADEWHGVPGVAPIAYGIATLVGLARLNDRAHWASDVFAGSVLGYATAQAVEYLHPRRHQQLNAVPIVMDHTAALAVHWSF
jgi:membrane-associated phospholipid phosphatase